MWPKVLISLVFLALFVIAITLFSYDSYSSRNDSNLAPGIYLEFKVPTMSRIRIVQTCVDIEVILPKPPDFLLLDSNCYRGLPVIYIPYDRVKNVVDQWILELISRETPEEIISKHSFGLLVRAYMVGISGEVIHKVFDSVTLRIGDFKTPQPVRYVIRPS